jgi:membrane-associated protease RseP (regulator of RpoE activity)
MSEEQKPPLQRAAHELEMAVADLFSVEDVTLGTPRQPEGIRFRGHLLLPSDKAYPLIAARLREKGYVAELRHDAEQGLDVLLLIRGVPFQAAGSRLWVNALLFGLTVLATLFVGATYSDQVPADASLVWLLTHLWLGWPFALSLMVILTGHELGHYFAGRYYKVPVSLPYFLPVPIPPLGTMGAFIIMKGRTINRRQMLTVGAAGPLVGFVLAVPILILGLSLSQIRPLVALQPGEGAFFEGNSILYLLLKWAQFGQILPGSGSPPTLLAALREAGAALLGTFSIDQGYDVFIHPVALAGWAGLLVTGLNLLPVGQLDGGHVLYSLVGQKARVLAWPVILLLVLLGLALWPGWLLWAALLFFFGHSHPDPMDDVTRLDTPRKVIAVLVLLVFVLTFTLSPIRLEGMALEESVGGSPASCCAMAALVAGAALLLGRWARARGRARRVG